MRVFLDDKREAPEGWIRTYTVAETIELLKTRQVMELSLDNDLGEGIPEGYLVLNKLEEIVFNDKTFPVPLMQVHSSNASRVQDMNRAISSIYRIERGHQMDIEQTIRQSIEHAKKNGFTLVHQDWGSLDSKCACPMGCVILQADDTNDILDDAPQASVQAAKLLHVSDTWVDSFTAGFDGEDLHEATHVKNAFEMGQKLRQELSPQDYFEFMQGHKQ